MSIFCTCCVSNIMFFKHLPFFSYLCNLSILCVEHPSCSYYLGLSDIMVDDSVVSPVVQVLIVPLTDDLIMLFNNVL